MRFVDTGPDIPDELLLARDEGNVLFFCGAGVSRARANLADFLKLAGDVMDDLGSLTGSQARRLHDSAKAKSYVPVDRMFSSLDLEFDPRDVRDAVARALKPTPNVNLDAHRMLIDLSRGPDGRPRLVTMVAFDELSRVLQPRNYGSKRKLVEQAEVVWSQIIQIMSDPVWPTPVIASGTLDLIETLELHNTRTGEMVARGDMNRRADITTLPPLAMDDAEELETYLHQYCIDAGVTFRLTSKDEVGKRLVNASRRAIGTALSVSQWAVALASMRRRGALHMEDLAHVLAIRASVSADANVFLLDNWEDINFEKVAPRDFGQARYKDNDEGEESI